MQAELGNLVLASVYVPNGNKDYAAKLAFVKHLIAWARELRDAGARSSCCAAT